MESAEPHGWTLMALPGGIRLDANTSLRGCRGTGGDGFENREGGKAPVLLFQQVTLHCQQGPAGPVGTHTARMALSTPMGKLRQG